MLRAQVTSKGGTTERALAVLEAAAVKAHDRRRGEGRGARARASWATRSAATRRSCTPCWTRRCKFLLDTVFGLFTYAFLLRFAMQWLRAPVPQSAGAGGRRRSPTGR